jgi:hypothetical protein
MSINQNLINAFSYLIERTKYVIEYHKNYAASNGLQFKLIAFERALKVISNVKYKIISGNDFKFYKGIGAGIIRRIDEILKTGSLTEEYPTIPVNLNNANTSNQPSTSSNAQKVPNVSRNTTPNNNHIPASREPEIGRARSRHVQSVNSMRCIASQLINQNQYLIQNLAQEHRREILKEKELSKTRERCNALQLLYLLKDRENQETLKTLINFTNIMMKQNGLNTNNDNSVNSPDSPSTSSCPNRPSSPSSQEYTFASDIKNIENTFFEKHSNVN